MPSLAVLQGQAARPEDRVLPDQDHSRRLYQALRRVRVGPGELQLPLPFTAFSLPSTAFSRSFSAFPLPFGAFSLHFQCLSLHFYCLSVPFLAFSFTAISVHFSVRTVAALNRSRATPRLGRGSTGWRCRTIRRGCTWR